MTYAEVNGGVMPAPDGKPCGRVVVSGESADVCGDHCVLVRLLLESAGPDETVTEVSRPTGNRTADNPYNARPSKRKPATWLSLSTVASILGTAGAAGYLHSTVALVVAAIELTVLLVIVLTLLIVILVVILRGSDEARKHLFRLLRWVANRPEPPAPSDAPVVDADSRITLEWFADHVINVDRQEVTRYRGTRGFPEPGTDGKYRVGDLIQFWLRRSSGPRRKQRRPHGHVDGKLPNT